MDISAPNCGNNRAPTPGKPDLPAMRIGELQESHRKAAAWWSELMSRRTTASSAGIPRSACAKIRRAHACIVDSRNANPGAAVPSEAKRCARRECRALAVPLRYRRAVPVIVISRTRAGCKSLHCAGMRHKAPRIWLRPDHSFGSADERRNLPSAPDENRDETTAPTVPPAPPRVVPCRARSGCR